DTLQRVQRRFVHVVCVEANRLLGVGRVHDLDLDVRGRDWRLDDRTSGRPDCLVVRVFALALVSRAGLNPNEVGGSFYPSVSHWLLSICAASQSQRLDCNGGYQNWKANVSRWRWIGTGWC